MFDSLLNSKFYNRCKHAFKCIRTRMVPIRRKKQAVIRFLKKDVADLLANGLDTHAFGRMDGMIIEMNHATCYDMIEQFCEDIGKQLSSLQKQRDCSQEAREAVSTLIFAAARYPDLPELCDLRHIFTERYGNFLEPFVSLEFVQMLDNKLFTNEQKLQVMQSIAEEFSVGLDKKSLERRLWATPETKNGLLEKDQVTQVEPAVPMSEKEKGDTLHERKSDTKHVDHKKRRESQLKSKVVHYAADGIGQMNENTTKQRSHKSGAEEHSVKQLEVTVPMSNRQNENEDFLLERKTRATPIGHKQKLEAELKPKDVQAIADGIGKINENTKRQHSDKSDVKECSEKSASSLDMEANTQNGVHKPNKKGVRPCVKELVEAIELDLNGLPKKGFGSVKFPETESNRISPLNASPKEAKKEHGVEKENNKGLGDHYRPHMNGGSDHTRRNADTGVRSHGLENQGHSSVNPSNGNATKRIPPYAKTNEGKNHAEKEEMNDRPQSLSNMGHPVQNGEQVPMRAAYMQPPYVKHKFNMQPVEDDPTKRTASDCSKHNIHGQTKHLAHMDVPRPLSVRRKKASAPADAYDGTPRNEVKSRTPSSHRMHSRRQKGAEDDYGQKGNGIDDGKNVQRTPRSQPRHSGRKHGTLYNDDYDGFMQCHQAGKDEAAIDFGNLLPRPANRHRRLRSRITNVQNGHVDEEERMMDKLLMDYSKTCLGADEAKGRTEINGTSNGNAEQMQCHPNGFGHPPGRAISLPQESVSWDEAVNVPARLTSLQPDCPSSVHVHPRMPDFHELAARVVALRNG